MSPGFHKLYEVAFLKSCLCVPFWVLPTSWAHIFVIILEAGTLVSHSAEPLCSYTHIPDRQWKYWREKVVILLPVQWYFKFWFFNQYTFHYLLSGPWSIHMLCRGSVATFGGRGTCRSSGPSLCSAHAPAFCPLREASINSLFLFRRNIRVCFFVFIFMIPYTLLFSESSSSNSLVSIFSQILLISFLKCVAYNMELLPPLIWIL